MDRSPIFVIVVVVAALGLFGLRIWSGRSAVDDDALVAGSRSVADRAMDGEPNAPGSAINADGQVRGHGSRTGGPATHDGRLAAVAGSRSGAGGSAGAGHSADVFIGGEGHHSGGVGVSASGRSGSAPGASIGIASGAGGGKSASGGFGVRAREHTDLVQQLAALPPSAPQKGGLDPAQPGQDVVLSVEHATDLQQSETATGVNTSDQGVGINFTPDAVVAFPDAGNVKGDAGSISFNVKPDWNGSEDQNNAFVQLQQDNQWANRLQVVRNGSYLRFLVADSGGVEHDISMLVNSWQANDQHQVTATWGDSQMSLYVDGRLIGQTSMTNPLQIPPGTPLLLGSKSGNYLGANATIDNFKVYGRALGANEVNQ